MKKLYGIPFLMGCYLSAQGQTEGEVSDLSNEISVPLREIWLMPEHESSFSPQFLDRVRLVNMQEVLNVCFGYRVDSIDIAKMIQIRILTDYFINLTRPDAVWRYFVHKTEEGQVISMVVGNKKGIELFEASGIVIN